MSITDQMTVDNTAVLASAAKLSAEIIMQVAGNDSSNQIDGQSITYHQAYDISLSMLQREVRKGEF